MERFVASVLMGMLSAGFTYFFTGGDMVLVFWAFIIAAVVTALVGPFFVGFLEG
jgi:hypothetical protein